MVNTESTAGNYFLLHFIVFIWGWTAILGKGIELPALQLVWLRMPIALAGIFLFLIIRRQRLYTDVKNLKVYFGIGLIVALHWITFYGAQGQQRIGDARLLLYRFVVLCVH